MLSKALHMLRLVDTYLQLGQTWNGIEGSGDEILNRAVGKEAVHLVLRNPKSVPVEEPE